jgi:hypothetical protein
LRGFAPIGANNLTSIRLRADEMIESDECRLMAHNAVSPRCRNSVAIGAQQTCRDGRERVDSTRMTHLRHQRPIML